MFDYRSSLVVVACVVAFSPCCFARQSGSRGAVPSVGSGSSVTQGFIQTPQAEAFQPSFSMTQGGVLPSGEATVSQSSLPAGASSAASQGSSLGIPDSSLVDPVFEMNDPTSIATVDHSTWDCFLSRYLITDGQGVNRLHYGHVSQADRVALKNYLNYLQAVDTRILNRDEQLAFWFNLYNAKTADLVLDNYPIRSVRQIKTKFTDFVGPFDDPAAVTVLGVPLSLNQIESGIVRPVWNDPRIHYALNCASLGCPNLSPTAWTAQHINGRLNAAAYQYINSNRGLQYGLRGVRASRIYKWYKVDFGGTDEAVLNHFRRYADECTLQKLQCQQKITGHFYDWSLNDARVSRRRILEPLIR